jgi:hypothetical protein
MRASARFCLNRDIATVTTERHRTLIRVAIALVVLSGLAATLAPVRAQTAPRPPMRPSEFGASVSTKPAPPATTAPAAPVSSPAAPAPSSVTVTKTEVPKPLPLNTPAPEVLKRVNAALNASRASCASIMIRRSRPRSSPTAPRWRCATPKWRRRTSIRSGRPRLNF